MVAIIRNPIEWSVDQVKAAGRHVASVGRSLRGSEKAGERRRPVVRRIELSDLRDVLVRGLADFGACRTDVVFLCLIYPIVGLALAQVALNSSFLPLLFPAASGFALLGPVAAVGLYEMSRRRERGQSTNWADAFGVIRSPSFGAIAVLGLILLGVFLAWLAAAQAIYLATLGPEPPASATAFLGDVFGTGAGRAMILVGCGVGFLFAVAALAVSVVSFPLLLDRDVGLGTAVVTSIRVVLANPAPMAAWGLIVAGGLVIGSIPLFLGLIVVMPVLGHATWHLYRKTVAR